MDLAKEAVERKDYKSAYLHLQTAHTIIPESEEPVVYFNYVRRLEKNRVNVVSPGPGTPLRTLTSSAQTKTSASRSARQMATVSASPIIVNKIKAQKSSSTVSSASTTKAPALTVEERMDSLSQQQTAVKGPASKKTSIPTQAVPSVKKIIPLDNELWQKQPDTPLEIETGDAIILEGDGLRRFLVVTPGAIDVSQPTKRQIVIAAQKRGSTIFHLWQDDRRWTFRINTIFPRVYSRDIQAQVPKTAEYNKPFEFAYTNDWDSYYRANKGDSLKRQSLNFRQWMGVYGDTPYGKFDSSVNFYMFKESTEATGYGVGLTQGRLGNFKDFTIRGFDTSKEFSELSLPGRYFRGLLFESPAFNRKITYSLIKGQDLAIYDYFGPEKVVRKSYIEGGKVLFNPTPDQFYSVNYARGWGDMRPLDFKDRVYSVEGQKLFERTTFYSEVAYDEDAIAYNLRSEYKADDWRMSWKFRDLNKDFYTITGPPSGQGEVGGQVNFQLSKEKFNLDSFFDLYRDRRSFNPAHPNALNVDFATSLSVPLGETSSWRSALYYADTPGYLNSRRDVRFGNTYYNRLPIWGGRQLTYYAGHNFQASRSSTTPTSDYNRNSLLIGIGIPLMGQLSYYLNYDYSWVANVKTKEHGQPSVLNTGLNYSYKIIGALFGYSGLSYRKEDNTMVSNSFLAGEDSLGGNLGLTYQPARDLEVFMDGRVQKIWAVNPDRQPYIEADLRFGVRSKWEIPISWSPSGTVSGTIFKDLNGNGIRDAGEIGLPRVRVKVGNKVVDTDALGHFKTGVRARKVQVTVAMETLPDGFVFSQQMTKDIYIEQGKTHTVDFGLSINSGIYGVVYYDDNQNGKLDPDDVFVQKVRIILDDTLTTYTDTEGSYNFSNMPPGEHRLLVDLNSIPMEYLPLIKLDQTVDVAEGVTYVLHIPLKKK